MDPDLIRLFLDVARCGSFAAAARDRDVEPSSVSRAIARLEQQFGFALFQRTTRAMTLTEAGTLLQARAAALIAAFDRLADDARCTLGVPSGLLRLTASIAFGQTVLIPRLATFRRRYPAVRLELILDDKPLDLIENRIDIAVRLGAEGRSDLHCEPLFPTRYQVVASPACSQSMGTLTHPSELTAHPVITLDLPDFRARWLFRSPDGTLDEVRVSSEVSVSSVLGVRAAALAGLGPALLADWMITEDLASGALLDLFPNHRVTATNFETAAWMLWPKSEIQPQKTSAALDFLRAELRTNVLTVPNKKGPAEFSRP